MIKKKDIWDGGGYLYNDGDIPECSYCGEDAQHRAIFSSAHSGILLCDSKTCIMDYVMNNIMTDELIHTQEEYEVCDECEEEECICEEEK